MTIILEDREAYARGWRDAIVAAAKLIGTPRNFKLNDGRSDIPNAARAKAAEQIRSLAPPATPSETAAKCGIEFSPFGLPAQSFIKSALCTLPVGHLGHHKWTAHFAPSGPPTVLDAAPPATPPAACATCRGTGNVWRTTGDLDDCPDCAGTGRDGRAR